MMSVTGLAETVHGIVDVRTRIDAVTERRLA
jgi:hypothetical protein